MKQTQQQKPKKVGEKELITEKHYHELASIAKELALTTGSCHKAIDIMTCLDIDMTFEPNEFNKNAQLVGSYLMRGILSDNAKEAPLELQNMAAGFIRWWPYLLKERGVHD